MNQEIHDKLMAENPQYREIMSQSRTVGARFDASGYRHMNLTGDLVRVVGTIVAYKEGPAFGMWTIQPDNAPIGQTVRVYY